MIIGGTASTGKTRMLINICNEKDGVFVTGEETSATLNNMGLETIIYELTNVRFESVEDLKNYIYKDYKEEHWSDIYLCIDNLPLFVKGIDYRNIHNISTKNLSFTYNLPCILD